MESKKIIKNLILEEFKEMEEVINKCKKYLINENWDNIKDKLKFYIYESLKDILGNINDIEKLEGNNE